MQVFEAKRVRPLVREFYETAWQSTMYTRQIFEQIGLQLTAYALKCHLPLRDLGGIRKIYAGPIARAGCGLFRPSVIQLLQSRLNELDLPLHTFGMGLSRHKNPATLSAEVYWNTLRDRSRSELCRSLILLYEMGAATGSTIVGAINELKALSVSSDNVIFLIGAISIDQIRGRLAQVTPDATLLIGSRWKYHEQPGASQYYLTHMFEEDWVAFPPRDWGDCVSGMRDESSVRAFLCWMGATIDVSPKDKEMLVNRWSSKIAANST